MATEDGAVWLSVISSAPGKQGYKSGEEANAVAAMEDLKAGRAVAESDTAPYGCSIKYKS